ncbi:MAG: site-specific integrase [Cyclobacteriaceae bacterium]|nr:site-specific integrase [Cyclobacteriaceae bacterium]
MSKEQWLKARGNNPRAENRQRQIWIQTAEVRVNKACEEIMKNGKPFSFERLENEIVFKETSKGILGIFQDTLNDLLKEKRIGTFKAYNNAFSAFQQFRKGKELKPDELTLQTLKDFEAYLKTPRTHKYRKTKKAAGKNTIAMYMRTLRIIFNQAIDRDPTLKICILLPENKMINVDIKIKLGAGSKGQALSAEEIQKLILIKAVPGTLAYEAKNLWLFSFYCQGINFRDIAYLQYKNIKPEHIEYVRRKTSETERKEELMQIPLSPIISEIIVYLGNPNKDENSFVFNIINNTMDIVEQDATIRQKLKVTNKWLRQICAANDLPPITTYWARHSYASLLKDLNESVELIREMLGHADNLYDRKLFEAIRYRTKAGSE